MIPLLMTQIWTTKFSTLSDKLFIGSTMALVGISIVFILLMIIVFSIFLMSAIIKKSRINNSTETQTAGDAKNTISAVNEKSDAELSANPLNADSELIAVITAAIAMISSSDGKADAPYPGFKVRSIRKVRFYNSNSYE